MGEWTSALSDGTNALLRLGATPVTSAGDILELFDLAPLLPKPASLGETAQALLERLRDGALTADELDVAVQSETATCPACGHRIPVELGFTTWCDECGWNVVAPDARSELGSPMSSRPQRGSNRG